jgi:hypothetical protein
MLSARIHVKDQTIPIRANSQHGLVISHALPTQALPGNTGASMYKDTQELIDALDELIDQIDRYHEHLTQLLAEMKKELPDE